MFRLATASVLFASYLLVGCTLDQVGVSPPRSSAVGTKQTYEIALNTYTEGIEVWSAQSKQLIGKTPLTIAFSCSVRSDGGIEVSSPGNCITLTPQPPNYNPGGLDGTLIVDFVKAGYQTSRHRIRVLYCPKGRPLPLAASVADIEDPFYRNLTLSRVPVVVPHPLDLAGKSIAVVPFEGDADFARVVESCLVTGVKYFESGSGDENTRMIRGPSHEEAYADYLNKTGANELPSVVSRSKLEQVVAEQDLQLTDLMDQKTAVKVGKLVGARYLMTGKATSSRRSDGPECSVPWAQLIDVQTGKVVWTYKPVEISRMNLTEEEARRFRATSIVGQLSRHLRYPDGVEVYRPDTKGFPDFMAN